MIIAVAGHVHHGKTSLVRALTGMHTDSLPEERARGMTIEPGHAHALLGATRVAFVDLPGHEQFMRQMIAGATAAHHALLVVAADDGLMPQTREHVAVLLALAQSTATVVISKADLVPDSQVQAVEADLRALLASTAWTDAPLLRTSVHAGQGLEALRSHLQALAEAWQPPAATGSFRLAVDRVFQRAGAGLVVAGTACSGTVAVGDELVCSPSGGTWRVRGVQVHGQATGRAQAGQRAALNLVPPAGSQAAPTRGDMLLAPPLHAPSRRLDVHWRPAVPLTNTHQAPSPNMPMPAPIPTQVQVHLHAAVRQARFIALGPQSSTQGGFAQLVLDEPFAALHGDRPLLRDPAARRVLGGGVVVDAWAPARGRATPERLAELLTQCNTDAAQALTALLAAHPEGLDGSIFERHRNLAPGAAASMALAAEAVCPSGFATGPWWVAGVHWQALQAQLQAQLAQHHAAEPASLGLTDAELVAGRGPAQAALSRAALRDLAATGRVVREGFVWRLPDHRAELSASDNALLARTTALMRALGPRPPPLGELAPLLELPLPEAEAFLQRAARLGHLVQVARNRYFLPESITALIDVARETAAASPDGRFEVIPFRDRSDLGRNLSIQVLEFFDRQRITRFVGGRRSVLATPDPAR